MQFVRRANALISPVALLQEGVCNLQRAFGVDKAKKKKSKKTVAKKTPVKRSAKRAKKK